MTDNVQLLIFEYYDGSKKEFMQDLLSITTLKKSTQEKLFTYLKRDKVKKY